MHPEEAGVEAEAEHDLGHRPEEEEQGQRAVVGGGEERRVDGDEEEVDQALEDVGRAVDRGVRGQLPEVSGEGQLRDLTSAPCRT